MYTYFFYKGKIISRSTVNGVLVRKDRDGP